MRTAIISAEYDTRNARQIDISIQINIQHDTKFVTSRSSEGGRNDKAKFL